MKAILVIDMPKECCDGCPCYYEEGYRCQVHMEIDEDLYHGKPSWCPLRPLPCKRETRVYWKSVGLGNIPTHEISDYDKGWNDCVDFLESEE